MKRIAIGAFVFMLAAVLLAGCGVSEQEKKERAEQKELYGQYAAILASGKTYEELSDTEKSTIDPILKNGLLKDEERYLKKNLENYEEKLSKMKDSKLISDQKNRPAPTAVQTTPTTASQKTDSVDTAKEPDNDSLMAYGQTVLEDNTQNIKFSRNIEDWNFTSTGLRYKISTYVTTNEGKEKCEIIITFDDDNYSTYVLDSLNIGNKEIV